MESLLPRIAKPQGNRQSGKFSQCENLKTRFAAAVRSLHREQLDEILGTTRKGKVGGNLKLAKRDSQPVLALYARRPTKLVGTFKGKKFTATVRKDGAIRFRGRVFLSPSVADISAVGHNINGWWFWKYQKSRGNWVRLRELRNAT